VPRRPDREPASKSLVDDQLADELLDRARVEGVELLGPDGLLSHVTKAVLERALGEELTHHLGYEKDPMLRVVADEPVRDVLAAELDELVREGVRRMLAAALEAEVQAYVAGFADQVDERGRRLVVRNGHARPRAVTTAGVVEVAAPRVNDRRVDPATGGRARFRSVVLPPWCRKSPKVAEVPAAAVPAPAVQG
jgi:transposase-like protein